MQCSADRRLEEFCQLQTCNDDICNLNNSTKRLGSRPEHQLQTVIALAMKQALGETQTLRAGCNKAGAKKKSARRRPPSRSAGRPKFNQLETQPSPTDQFGEDRCTQFRVIVVTDPQTNKHTMPARPPARCKRTDRTDNNRN